MMMMMIPSEASGAVLGGGERIASMANSQVQHRLEEDFRR